MPRKYTKKKRTYKRRRPHKKRGSGFVYRTSYARAGQPRGANWGFLSKTIGMPVKLPVKLRYQDTYFNMSTAAALFQTANAFSGNSPYDPDATGVGVQPYEYDELSSLYTYYICKASKIKCTFYTNQTIANCPKITALIHPWQGSGGPTYSELPDLKQIRWARWSLLSADKAANKSLVVKNYCSSKKFFNTTISTDGDYSSNINTNPTKRWYWRVITDSADYAVACTIYMDVSITYYMEFSRRESMDQS